MGVLPQKCLSVKHLISCILVDFYSSICAFSASFYSGNIFFSVKEKTTFSVPKEITIMEYNAVRLSGILDFSKLSAN